MTGLCKILTVAVIAAAAPAALGQANPGGGGPGGNPQQFRQRMEDRLKADLGVNEDEWKALQPRIEKVMELQRSAFMRGPGRRGGRGGNGGDPNQSLAPSTPVQAKAQELQKVLDNKDAKPEEIKAALQALRDARAQAREDLTKAQGDLRDLLTTRQESVLVMAGLLD